MSIICVQISNIKNGRKTNNFKNVVGLLLLTNGLNPNYINFFSTLGLSSSFDNLVFQKKTALVGIEREKIYKNKLKEKTSYINFNSNCY
jgi:hypothetical protein